MNQHKQLPKEIQPGATVARAIFGDVDRSAIDVEARTVEIAFSSETPVERWWGMEILDHSKGAMRDKRIKRGGALLMDHNWNDQVGVVSQVRIDADRVGRATVRFGRSTRASEIFQDVVDGIRSNISFLYRIHKAVLESSEEGVETYRVTDWEPYEISIVSVPADINVGVGRSADAPDPETPNPEKNIMTDPTPTRTADPAPAPAPTPVDTSRFVSQGADAENKRVTDILAIANADAYKRYNLGDLATEAVRSKWTVDEFRSKAMDKMSSAPLPSADIGMTDKEARQYSVVRALHMLANPGDANARKLAGFEIECSAAAAQRSGKTPQGLLVPYDVLKRDLTVGTPADGGNLVATDLLSGSFIELLRDALLLPGLGARVLTGLVGNIAVPKQTGAATAYWVAEGNAPTESKQAIGQVPMSPKTVGAFTDISRKLLLQSSIDVESFVKGDLAQVLGLAIQQVCIKGGGSNEPTGILSTVGIGSVAGGTDGAAPNWANIVELETDVSVANAAIGTLAYLTNAKVRGKLKTTSKVSGQNGFIWDDGANPLNGYNAAVTNAVASNLTKGSGTNLSAIIFGNFADLVIGMWGGLDLMVDPYSNSTSGTVRVVALQDVDCAIRNAGSFSAMLDAITV